MEVKKKQFIIVEDHLLLPVFYLRPLIILKGKCCAGNLYMEFYYNFCSGGDKNVHTYVQVQLKCGSEMFHYNFLEEHIGRVILYETPLDSLNEVFLMFLFLYHITTKGGVRKP